MNEDASSAAALRETAATLHRRADVLIDELRAVAGKPQRDYTASEEAELAETWKNSKIAEDMQRQMEAFNKIAAQGANKDGVEKEYVDAETRSFREELLVELSRQVDLLERVALELKKSRLI